MFSRITYWHLSVKMEILYPIKQIDPVETKSVFSLSHYINHVSSRLAKLKHDLNRTPVSIPSKRIPPSTTFCYSSDFVSLLRLWRRDAEDRFFIMLLLSLSAMQQLLICPIGMFIAVPSVPFRVVFTIIALHRSVFTCQFTFCIQLSPTLKFGLVVPPYDYYYTAALK